MSKADYQTVAAAIKIEVRYIQTLMDSDARRSAAWTVRQIVYRLDRQFSKKNPRYDQRIFMEACGLVYGDTEGWHVA